MNKKTLSESDICDKFIRPAMERAGWNGMDQIYSQYPLRAGRMVVRGRQARRDVTTVLRADYALFHKINIPLAGIEKPSVGLFEYEYSQYYLYPVPLIVVVSAVRSRMPEKQAQKPPRKSPALQASGRGSIPSNASSAS